MKLIPTPAVLVCAAVVASFGLTGCIGQETIRASAYGPTEAEAKQHAKDQLDEQAKGRKVMTNVAYKVKVLPQGNGGEVYMATAAERVK
ncbi:MAG TPA: hypothetical protein VM008_15680 [Phycisphaerae bacterium]|nr:hypothetical protein [Phycisphaerae bacterium]